MKTNYILRIISRVLSIVMDNNQPMNDLETAHILICIALNWTEHTCLLSRKYASYRADLSWQPLPT